VLSIGSAVFFWALQQTRLPVLFTASQPSAGLEPLNTGAREGANEAALGYTFCSLSPGAGAPGED
jgi:hypothetical protein